MALDPGTWQPHEWLTSGVLALIALSLGLQRVLNLFKRGKVEGARVDAEGDILQGLREELRRLRDEFEAESRKRQDMDKLIHEQSIELTVTKGLMVRLLEVLRQKKIELPPDIQQDVNRLLFQQR